MSARANRAPWTAEEFFAWQETQDERHELIGGYPVKMMTGASQRHDVIVVNIIGGLQSRLRGTPCRPFTADGSVQTKADQIRRPDVGVDCAPLDPDGYKANGPTAVFEVFSPSTRSSDIVVKANEYMAMPTLRHIVFVEPKISRVVHWRRGQDLKWDFSVLEGETAVLDLQAIDVVLRLSEIYEGLPFE